MANWKLRNKDGSRDTKPGDISHLGRIDPVERDASWLSPNSSWSRTPSEVKDINKNYSESVRREFRQSEDAGSRKKKEK